MNESVIQIDPEILSGTPVFAGTRVPIKSLFDWLETETLDYFLENFLSVKKEQALAVLSHVNQFIEQEKNENIA